MLNKRSIGSKGESLAAEFLQKAGYSIRDRNIHVGRLGEIDIIAENEKTLVFIEVKLSKKNALFDPIYKVTPSKQARLFKIAEIYLSDKQIEKDIRFDVITIIQGKKNADIKHIKDAFRG